jgi:hypothetical protein
MKGDFSRRIFDATKHYSGVLMQQGRVQLDADWNEQHAIGEHRTQTEARDVIGACGAPRAAAGFEISSDGNGLRIGAGRYYVDGILCENEQDVAFDAQPHLPNAPDIRAVLEKAKTTLGIALLDVWQRHVTVLDDGRLRETALGGPDTTTRIQTIWQVNVLPVSEDSRGGDRLRELVAQRADLQSKLASLKQQLNTLNDQLANLQARLAQLPPTSIQRRQIQLQIGRVQAAIDQTNADTTAATNQLAEIDAEITKLRERGQVRCDTQFDEWDALFAPGGTLNARTQPPEPESDPCLLPPSAGYRRLENQLYRVEVHDGGGLGTATFKWSRDNGTVVTAIERISGSVITVADLGPDEVLGFAPGQWVELSDDALELNGMPGQLARIETVNAATREITLLDVTPTPLAPTESGVDPARRPKLRRWDFTEQAGAPATAADWLTLEDGIAVQFGQDSYRTGDYWLIPARTGTGEIEWPPFGVPNTAPIAQPPLGIQHHYCRLALLRVNDGVLEVASDCRNIFDPLTERATATAMHVVGVNWRNDDLFDLRTFTQNGLRITLDGPPSPLSVHEASVIVQAEMPYNPSGQGEANNQLNVRLIVRGQVGIDPEAPNVITWRFVQAQVDNVRRLISRLAAEEPAQPAGTTRGRRRGAAAAAVPTARAVVPLNTIRIRVTLVGRQIWQDIGERQVYLDGQVFGMPAKRRTGEDCSTIGLPSGDGARASDFESWFYLGGERRQTVLTADRLRFLHVANRENEIGAFELPAAQAVTVDPKEINVLEITFSRAVNPDGFVPNGGRQSMRLSLLSGGQEKQRFAGDLTLTDAVARFTLRDPVVLPVGAYRLVIAGTESNDLQPVRAADDGSFLDGNYDGQNGGDFSLDFIVR